MDLETAWVAGLVEGEGSFFVYNKRGKRTAAFACNMTDEDVVWRLWRWCNDIMPTPEPKLNKKDDNPNHQDQWFLRVDKMALIEQIGLRLFDNLGERRQQAVAHVLEANQQRREKMNGEWDGRR